MDLSTIANRISVNRPSMRMKYWKATLNPNPNCIPGYLTQSKEQVWGYLENEFPKDYHEFQYVLEVEVDVGGLLELPGTMGPDAWFDKWSYNVKPGFYYKENDHTSGGPLGVIMVNQPMRGKIVGAYQLSKIEDGSSAWAEDLKHFRFSTRDLDNPHTIEESLQVQSDMELNSERKMNELHREMGIDSRVDRRKRHINISDD